MAMIAWFFLAAAALLLQPKLALFDCPLNLTLALVYAFSIKTAPHQPAASGSSDVTPEIMSAAFGAGIGLVEDVMTGFILGPNLLSKGLAGLVSSLVYREIFFQWESVLGGVVLAVLTMLDCLVVIAARQLFSNASIGGPAVANLLIIQSIMNIPLGLVLRPGHQIPGPKFRWFHKRRYT
jgi:hypothetical protein